MQANIYFWYLAQFFSNWENVSDKCCRENRNTHFTFNNIFQKIVPFTR